MKKYLLIFGFIFGSFFSEAQVDEDQLGAWYMYFFKTEFGDGPWGLQGDVQWRNWDMGGDLEQLLIRGGLTYNPKEADILLTVGYANIVTGTFGESTATIDENRIYQEAMYPAKIGSRIYLNHRFRFEQRFLANGEFRTRYRFNLFMNVPLNKKEMTENSFYLALYNELFMKGTRKKGNSEEVEVFDRNRLYLGLGYFLKSNLRAQVGFMDQFSESWRKNQFQLSLHHKF